MIHADKSCISDDAQTSWSDKSQILEADAVFKMEASDFYKNLSLLSKERKNVVTQDVVNHYHNAYKIAEKTQRKDHANIVEEMRADIQEARLFGECFMI